MRKRASECGIPRGQCGAVTFVQRFGSALNLHPHGHMICTDGVYAALPGESPRFYPLSPPEHRDVVWVTQTIVTRIQALLEVDLATDDTVGELYMDGVANRIRTGPRSGHKTSMADGNGGLVTDQEPPPAVLRCANYQGFSVHANVAVRASDRKRLESLCKYAARPPLAHERLQETSGGRLDLSDENALAERPDARRDGADRTDRETGRTRSAAALSHCEPPRVVLPATPSTPCPKRVV